MKNIFLLIIASFLSISIFSQILPNPDFESWETNPFPNYEDPEFWNTPNSLTSLVGEITTTKSEDAFSGNYSPRMETIEIQFGENTFQVPGLVTYADFEIDFISLDFTFGGGLFLQKKVSRLKGKYKYKSVDGDSASALIYCFRHPEGEDIDTIGVGLKYLHEATDWTDFSVDMVYYNSTTPDTFNILLMSTGTFQIGFMPPGSVLQVDNLSVDTLVNSIDPQYAVETRLFPNPAKEKITFELEKEGVGRTLTIFDITGRMVNTIPFDGKRITANLRHLSAGNYNYQIHDKNHLLNNGSFLKQ